MMTGDIKIKKYIIDYQVPFGYPLTPTNLQIDYGSPSICASPTTSTTVGFCNGVQPYTGPTNMRVNPNQLLTLPEGPTTIRRATNEFILTYAILVYNSGLANAYDLVITDLVGDGSSAASLPPISVTNCQANWASTGIQVPGICTSSSGTLTFTMTSGINNPLPPSGTVDGYSSTAAILITFDARFRPNSPSCRVDNKAKITQFTDTPGGIDQGEVEGVKEGACGDGGERNGE